MGEYEVASLSRRAGASMIDVLAVVLVLGTGAALVLAVGRRSSERVRALGRRLGEIAGPWMTAEERSPSEQVVYAAGEGAVAVLTRNWRSPGFRIMGLRTVEVHGGRPVSVRAALIRHAASKALSFLTARATLPRIQRSTERLQALQPRLKELQRQYADDPDRRRAELMTFYKQAGANPLGSCGLAVPGIVVRHLPALIPPLHQDLVARLAGTVVVRD